MGGLESKLEFDPDVDTEDEEIKKIFKMFSDLKTKLGPGAKYAMYGGELARQIDNISKPEHRWDPTQISLFRETLAKYEEYLNQQDINEELEYIIAGYFNLGITCIYDKLKSLIVDDAGTFAYEKSKYYFDIVKNLLEKNKSKLTQIELLESFLKYGLLGHDIFATCMGTFKLHFQMHRSKQKLKDDKSASIIKTKKKKIKVKYDKLPYELTREERKADNYATKVTENEIRQDITAADVLAQSICQYYNDHFFPSKAVDLVKHAATNLKKINPAKHLIYFLCIDSHMQVFTLMTNKLSIIINAHYPYEKIDELCHLPTVRTKMQTIFRVFVSMLRDLIYIQKNVESIASIAFLPETKRIIDENLKKMATELIDAEEMLKKTETAIETETNKKIVQEKKRLDEFCKVLNKREKIKKKIFQQKSLDFLREDDKQEDISTEIVKEKELIEKQTEDQELKTKAYQLYLEGKYLEAIKIHKGLLPKVLANATTLDDFIAIMGIADCYKAWSEWEVSNKKFATQLSRNARDNYKLALKGLSEGLAKLDPGTAIHEEWKKWHDFAKKLAPKPYVERIEVMPIPALASIQTDTKTQSTPKMFAPNKIEQVKAQEPLVIKSKAFNMPLSQWLDSKLQIMNENDMDARVVGGAIRDALLGKTANDIDVTVSASPEKVKTLLQTEGLIVGMRPILKISEAEESLEITPLCAKPDGRPQKQIQLDDNALVFYTPADSILEDALTRDFPINALYYNPKTKEVIDPTGKGLDDVQAGLIRTIINPERSFQEDPLRMLRAIRLSVKLNFKIGGKTQTAIKNNVALLQNIPPERLLRELRKFVADGNLNKSIKLLEELGLLQFIFPDTSQLFKVNSSRARTCLEVMLDAVSNANMPESYKDLPFFLAAMLWAPIEKKLTHYKFFPDSYDYGEIITIMESTLDAHKKTLALTEDLKNSIRLIWRAYFYSKYRQQDTFLTEYPYSVDDAMRMNNFLDLHNQAAMQFNSYYPQASMWIPKNDVSSSLENDMGAKAKEENMFTVRH